MPVPFADAIDHLTAELERLELLLRRQVLRLRAAHILTEDDLRGLYIPDAQVDAMLRQGVLGGLPGSDAAGIQQQLEELETIISGRAQAARAAGVALPLWDIADRLGLSAFEQRVLVLAAAPELDQRYEVLFSYAQNDVTRKRPTIGLALSLFCAGFRDAADRGASFLPDAPLRKTELIRLGEDGQDKDPTHPSRSIRLDHRMARFLLGRQELDERLVPFTHAIDPQRDSPELVMADAAREELCGISRALQQSAGVALIEGAPGAGKLAAATAICGQMGLPLLCADLPASGEKPGRWLELVTILIREALLCKSAIHLRHFDALLANDDLSLADRAVAAFAAASIPLFLGSQIPWRPQEMRAPLHFSHLRLPMPAFTERVRLWKDALSANGHSPASGSIDFALLANKFSLTPGQVCAAAEHARHFADLRGEPDNRVREEDVHQAARRQSNQQLRRLAQKVVPSHTWEHIVLPPRTRQQLREICLHVQYRHIVYWEWGFDRHSLGKGVKAMFSGLSGVGKTMAAEVLANELGLDLYKIDLSTVVSKYIGETEKNLSAIFQEAQSSNAMLFFDEADALFGRRSEIKDAHDRYANIEVSYLLQKVEEYEGIVILATNLAKNIDDAFARRLHHSIEFPFPDAAYREKIWRGMFTSEAPLDDGIDFGFLARQFELAGGSIRNVATSAAFLAASGGGQIKMEHLVQATARELHKMGRLPLKSSFREYFEVIREGQ